MKHPSTQLLHGWRIDAAGLGVCLAVTVLVYAVLVRPSMSRQRAYEAALPELKQRTDEVQQARRELTALQDDWETTRSQLADLPLRLESPTKVNSRLANLTDLATQSGLEIHQLLPDTLRPGQRYDIVPIGLKGSGDFEQVTRFMSQVHARFADVAVVRFDLASNRTADPTARFEIGLAWYTLPAIGLVEN